MQLLPAALALALLLSNLVPGGGLSLESLLTNMRCKCIKSTAQVINLGLILAIDVTPPGIHCRRKEIILTLKKNKKVCVAPEAPWIQLLIHKLMQRYATPSNQKPSSVTNALAGRSPSPDSFIFISFLPQNPQECHQKRSGGAATAGSRAVGWGSRAVVPTPRPISPSIWIQEQITSHGYLFLCRDSSNITPPC
uniref:Chemokine interleukin-8-like domain-containing protein n=2 Tax=Telluraves TaxID=3073808 RepID=A0A8C0F572_BUBBB